MLTLEELRSVSLVVFDFDGVFTDNAVYVDESGIESVRCSRSDGLGLQRLRDVGVQTLILSTETNSVVGKRAAKLRVECLQGVSDKRAALEKLLEERGIPANSVMFVGNDINDVGAFGLVGIAVGVADSYPEIIPHLNCRTSRNGGQGAVREVCDHIYFAQRHES